MYLGYIARFRSADPTLFQNPLTQLLPGGAACIFLAYTSWILRDPGHMPYAGHGQHVTFTTNQGSNYALVVGKDRNVSSPRSMIVLGVHYAQEGEAPGGQYAYESRLAIQHGAELCTPLTDADSLIGQMIRVYEEYIP